MANLRNTTSLGYGPNKLVKTSVKSYDEARNIVKEVDSADASNLIVTFDETGATANSLKDCKTMILCNEGKTALEVSIKLTRITPAEPDSSGIITVYVKLFLSPGELYSFPNGKMALYGSDTSICLGASSTLTPGASGTLYVDTGATLATNLENTEDHIDVSDGKIFKVGDYVQVGINSTTATRKEIMKVTAITDGSGADDDLTPADLTVDREKFGTSKADKDSQTDSTNGAVSGAKVYWPYFNAFYNHDRVLRGSSQLAISDQNGKFKAFNLLGMGRNNTDIEGIVPGSVAFRFYSKAFQDVAFANPVTSATQTNLTASTAYAFDITIADSAATTLSFTTSTVTTLGGATGVIQTINNALDAAYKDSSHGLYGFKATCSIVGGQLRFTDGTNMHAHDGTNGSKILLASASSGTNLFSGTAGIFPAIADVLAAFSPALGDATVTDSVTGTTTTNDAAYMIDDSQGNLIYPATSSTKVGTINYITGEHSFTIPSLPYASWEVTANSNSGFSGGSRSAASQSGNHIHEIKARSVNTKVNGKIGAYIFK